MIATSPAALFRLASFVVFACSASIACQAADGVSTRPVRSVPICSGVSLSANYLALAGPDQGPGFRFVLVNRTAREIRLAQPVPSSSHWYARSNGRWLWRASNGAGGSLLDAGNEHGQGGSVCASGGGRNQAPDATAAPVEGMGRKPAGEPRTRVQAGLSDVLLSRRARVPGGLRLCISCGRRPAGRASFLWFAVRSRSHAAKIVSLSLVGFGFPSNQAPEYGFLSVK